MPVGAIDIDHTYGSRAPSPKLHSQELGEKIKSTREVKAPVLKEFEEKIKSTQENKAPKLQELDEKIKSTRADKAVKKRMVVLPFVMPPKDFWEAYSNRTIRPCY